MSPAYLSSLGVSLVTGRDLEPGDETRSPVPTVLSRRLAREVFGTTDILGRQVEFGGFHGLVVGVAEDVRHQAYEQDVDPVLYMPWELRGADWPFLNLGIRTDAPLEAVAPAIRETVWDLDPTLPVPSVVTMETRMSRSVAEERFVSALVATFAGLALLLAAGGVYATLLYAVRRREREMGIRLALGAGRRDVIRLVLKRGLVLTATGVASGLAGAWASARVLESLVFGISPRDPVTLAAVSAIMIGVALAACLSPALRAGSTDPIETLRVE